jgi:lysine biosynthesis protein LysW
VISVHKPREGNVIVCQACGIELEIIHTDPFVVDFTEDWQEDWEEWEEEETYR